MEERITRLEMRLETQERANGEVLTLLKEIKHAIEQSALASAACRTRQDERWGNHGEVHAGLKAQVNGTTREVTDTRIAMARMIGAGVAGGGVITGLIELIKFLVSK